MHGNFPVRKAVSLRCLAQGRTEAEKIMISHPCAVFRAELLYHRLNQIVPLVPGKVNVNVRRVRAGGVEEALKIKIVPYRIDIGNSKGIRNDGSRPRTTPTGSVRAIDAPCHFHNLVHTEKIRRETRFLYYVQFIFNALSRYVIQCFITQASAGVNPLSQFRAGIFPIRWKYKAVEQGVELAGFRNLGASL